MDRLLHVLCSQLVVSPALVSQAMAQPTAPSYTVTIIQGPSCGFLGLAPIFLNDLNDSGVVVGSYEHCVDTDLDVGFIWTPKQGMTLYQTLPGMNTAIPRDINDSSQSTGYVTFAGSGVGWTAFSAQGTQFTTILGVPPGGTHTRGHAINNNGWIVGDWGNTVTGVPTPMHAALWQDAQFIDLGAFSPDSLSQAFDVNDNNQIVGWFGPPGGSNRRAFIWQNGRFIDLGLLPRGTSSTARAISNSGLVVGSATVPGPSPSGFVGHPFLWKKGKMVDLGMLPGLIAGSANAVNDGGEIVGGCQDLTGGTHRGFLWSDGTMWDLNDLIDIELELTIIEASAINNAGQIAASAWNESGDLFGMILSLIDPPNIPADLTGDGVVDGDDLMMLLSSWSIPPSAPGCKGARPGACLADINQDGVVNGIDLGILLANWTLP